MKRDDFVRNEFQQRGIPQPISEEISEEQFSKDWSEDEQAEENLTEAELRYRQFVEEDSKKQKLSARSWKPAKDRKRLEAKFLELYQLYISEEDEARCRIYMDSMLDILGQLKTSVVYNRICGKTVFHEGDELDIVQEAHLGVAKMLMQDKEKQEPANNPLLRANVIYKRETLNYLEYYGLYKRDRHTVRENKGLKKADIRSAPSIESIAADRGCEDKTDRIPGFSTNPFDEADHLNPETSLRILLQYLQQLMDSRNVPAAPLAVMYARVLYQTENLLTAESFDRLVDQKMKEKKWSTCEEDGHYDEHVSKAVEELSRIPSATSPDWAVDRMGTMTIGQLREDSEASLQASLGSVWRELNPGIMPVLKDKLRWGNAFTQQLPQTASEFAPSTWQELVYKYCFTKKKIEKWASDAHNSAVIAAAKTICQDESMTEYILTAFSAKSRIKKEVRKRKEEFTK